MFGRGFRLLSDRFLRVSIDKICKMYVAYTLQYIILNGMGLELELEFALTRERGTEYFFTS